MMNNKGFTVIEMLITIVIIGVILSLLIPGYITIYSQIKRNSLYNKISQIEINALKYGNNIKDEIKNSTCIDINVDTLITKGYLTSENEGRNELINPTTGAPLNGTVRICYCDNTYDLNSNYAEPYNSTIHYHKGEKVIYNDKIYECIVDAPPNSISENYVFNPTTTTISTRIGETTVTPVSISTAYKVADKYFKEVTC